MRSGNDRQRLHGQWRRGVLTAATLLVAACAPPVARYYPLDAGRSWTYAMAIQPASGQAVTANSEVTNLQERTVTGHTVTPQATEATGQRRLRFISADERSVVEIAEGRQRIRAADEESS